jgi:hypothetical protein
MNFFLKNSPIKGKKIVAVYFLKSELRSGQLIRIRDSSWWVANLAKKMGFSIDAIISQEKVAEYYRSHRDAVFVYFDDASYSGEQLVERARTFDHLIKESGKTATLTAIIPYCAQTALNSVEDYKRFDQRNINLVFSEKLKTTGEWLDEVISDKTEREAIAKWLVSITPRYLGIPLNYFEHKMPDNFSFPQAILEGKVYDENGDRIPEIEHRFLPNIIPPYVNQTE